MAQLNMDTLARALGWKENCKWWASLRVANWDSLFAKVDEELGLRVPAIGKRIEVGD